MEWRYNMKIKLKRGLSSNITALNLDQGEPAFCTDTGKLYVGDGTQNILINPDDGIATEAGKLSVARKISLSGDASGNVSFDGSTDVTLSVTVADDSHNHIISNVDGLQSALDGKVDDSRVLTDVPLNAKFTDTVTTINGKTGAITKADIVALGIPAQDTNTTYSAATTSAAGLMSAADKTKLDGIATGANNYVHPTTHPASMITETTTKRFVSDTEKSTWNSNKITVGKTQPNSGWWFEEID